MCLVNVLDKCIMLIKKGFSVENFLGNCWCVLVDIMFFNNIVVIVVYLLGSRDILIENLILVVMILFIGSILIFVVFIYWVVNCGVWLFSVLLI